jgi:PAS domain S-box-containing protein
LHWSPETYHIVGLDEREPVPRVADFLELVHPDDEPVVREALTRVARGGSNRTVEFRVRRPDGEQRWLQQTVERVRDAPDGRTVLAGVVRDVSDQRRAVEQLQHAQRMEVVGQYAGTIAHDVNNLATVIMGYSNLATVEAREQRDPGAELAQITKAADAIATLTRQLLAFSRRDVLEPTVFDVNDTVRSLEPAVRSLLGPRVRLEIGMHPAGAYVRADESQLEQVVLNLALNARDATLPGGMITIETLVADFESRRCGDGAWLGAGSYVGVRVADTGFGMDDVTRHRCFEPFFTTKSLGRGTGLGLATVAGIVHRHGGATDVETEHGLGSAFTVWLPRAAATARTAPESSPPVAAELRRATGT